MGAANLFGFWNSCVCPSERWFDFVPGISTIDEFYYRTRTKCSLLSFKCAKFENDAPTLHICDNLCLCIGRA